MDEHHWQLAVVTDRNETLTITGHQPQVLPLHQSLRTQQIEAYIYVLRDNRWRFWEHQDRIAPRTETITA